MSDLLNKVSNTSDILNLNCICIFSLSFSNAILSIKAVANPSPPLNTKLDLQPIISASITHPNNPRIPPSACAEFSSPIPSRSEEHTSELQSPYDLVCRLLLEKKKKKRITNSTINKKNKD